VRTANLLRALLATAFLAAAGPLHAQGSGAFTVSAVVLSKSNCKFVGSSSGTMNFPSVDPSSTSDAVATVNFTIRCGGSAASATFAMAAGDGLWALTPGAQRMRHETTTTEFVPYSLGFSPSSATIPKNTEQAIVVTGRITPASMQSALAGNYSDTVAITVSP
jgi:spore coat protein U-like protein